MSVEEFPVPKLHAWNGMLVQKVLKFRGENCRFVKVKANEDHMWYESSGQLSALTSKLPLNPPEFAPTVGVPPYTNLPHLAIGGASCKVKVGPAAPTYGTCEVCNLSMPLHWGSTFCVVNVMQMHAVSMGVVHAAQNCSAILRAGLSLL